MSGFSLTTTNKLRANTKKELTYHLTSKTKHIKRPNKEPTEYSYLLTIRCVQQICVGLSPTNTQWSRDSNTTPRTIFTDNEIQTFTIQTKLTLERHWYRTQKPTHKFWELSNLRIATKPLRDNRTSQSNFRKEDEKSNIQFRRTNPKTGNRV